LHRRGNFETHIFNAPIRAYLSPDVSIARLRWIVEPGSDFFIVYDQGWRTGSGRF
jgi:hypothetical protein